MSGIIKVYNQQTNQWEAILVGTQGPQGSTGGVSIDNNVNNYILTATGTQSLHGEQGLTWDGSTMGIQGNIIPVDNDTYDLGSPTKQWRDLYLSAGSLYVDGTKVLSSQTAELTITTDLGQSLKILESGADDITLQVETGNIELKGTVEIQSGKKIIDSAATQVIIGDSLKVEGDILPDINVSRDLGSSTLRWRDLYLSGNTLHLGDTKFTRTETGDIEVKDGSGNRKKVIADAIELRKGGKTVKIDIDENSGQLITTANDSVESTVNVPSLEARDSVIQADVDSLETRLIAEISTEKGRVDAILTGASADTDTFAEVVSLVNAVDTTNDQAFAAYALKTDASVDSLEAKVTLVGTSGNERTGTITLSGGGATTISQSGGAITISTPTVAGAQGPQGWQGIAGTIGVDGATGAQGPQGNVGATGAQGVQGPAGTSGSGTANYLTKWNGSSSQTNSLIYDNGTNVGIGTTSPSSFSGYTTLSINSSIGGGGILNLMVNGSNALRIVSATDRTYLYEERNLPITISTNNIERMRVNADGNIVPGTNGTQNLGSSTYRWNTVYTSDLSLKNDVGDWTIVEGEDDLFLYNNKRDKVYKFNLTEVDKETAPKKRS